MKDIEILDNGESEVQITTIGTVIGSDSEGNPIEQNFSEESLKDIANKQTEDILVDVDHESELEGKTEAKGWLSNLKFIEGKGLFGKIKWTDIGRKLIENRVFRWLSPSWLLNEDKTPNYMTSCALTNKPSQIGRIKPIINHIEDLPIVVKEPIIKQEFDNSFTDNIEDLNKDILNMNKEELKQLIIDTLQEIEAAKKEAEIVEEVKEETETKPDSDIPEVKEDIVEVKEDDKVKVIENNDVTPDVKEEVKEEAIKIESLNSAPSPIINEPEWKHLKGEAFRNWVKKHPMGI